MKNWFALVFILVISVGTLKAEETPKSKAPEKTSLNGMVIEEATSEPLMGATIKIEKLDKVIYTEFDGTFNCSDLAPGTYEVTVTFPSFEERTLKLSLHDHVHQLIIKL